MIGMLYLERTLSHRSCVFFEIAEVEIRIEPTWPTKCIMIMLCMRSLFSMADAWMVGLDGHPSSLGSTMGYKEMEGNIRK